jgi:dTDP-glucose 4,6-dehydratase
VPLYGQGENVRDWLFVEDHCAAIHLLVSKGEAGEIYNVGAGEQIPNLELTRVILEAMGKDDSWIEFVPDRPGHDRRYAVDSSKIRGLGWAPRNSFADRLQDTIAWYRDRRDWWGHLVKGTF